MFALNILLLYSLVDFNQKLLSIKFNTCHGSFETYENFIRSRNKFEAVQYNFVYAGCVF